MITNLLSLREAEIFSTLKELKGCYFVVIGGYAVNAYTLPRFSLDCDLVIKDENELRKIGKVLLKIGYKKEKLPKGPQYQGSFCRYEKKLDNNFVVSMDIMIGSVTDRMTGAVFSAEWIFEHSSMKTLKGKTIMGDIKMRIIDIDALLVMKIISCRSTDIRDVFMAFPKAQNKEWIKSEVQLRYNLKERITKIIGWISSKQFKDGLSGVYGYFDQKVFEKHKNAILSFTLMAH